MCNSFLRSTQNCSKLLTRAMLKLRTLQDYSLGTPNQSGSFILALCFSLLLCSYNTLVSTVNGSSLAAMLCLWGLSAAELVSATSQVSLKPNKRRRLSLELLKNSRRLIPSNLVWIHLYRGALNLETSISGIQVDKSLFSKDSTWELSQTSQLRSSVTRDLESQQ